MAVGEHQAGKDWGEVAAAVPCREVFGICFDFARLGQRKMPYQRGPRYQQQELATVVGSASQFGCPTRLEDPRVENNDLEQEEEANTAKLNTIAAVDSYRYTGVLADWMARHTKSSKNRLARGEDLERQCAVVRGFAGADHIAGLEADDHPFHVEAAYTGYYIGFPVGVHPWGVVHTAELEVGRDAGDLAAHTGSAFVLRGFARRVKAEAAGTDQGHRAYQVDEGAAVVDDYLPAEAAHNTEDAVAAADF